jgi:NAD(P)-dependent dehydrogenase (short-subunit alcohol dehydrogenase family)
VSRADDVAAIVTTCIAAFGRIDVLHNNVGIVDVGGPVETMEESWDQVADCQPERARSLAAHRVAARCIDGF